ncbi:MAG: hypothetical protein MUO24_03555 [Desulfobacterales bacterium]|nr:hypothetical protein [Desulfobacterales bacterium]
MTNPPVFAHTNLPVETQKEIRRLLRQIPTWRLEQQYRSLTAGEHVDVGIVGLDRAYATSAIAEILWERGKLGGSMYTSGISEPESSLRREGSIGGNLAIALREHTINDITQEQMNRIVRRLRDIPLADRMVPQRVGMVLRDELGEQKALEYADKAIANGLVKARDYEALRAGILLTVPEKERPINVLGPAARELVHQQHKLQQDIGRIRAMGDKSLEKAANNLNKDVEKLRRSWGL